MMSIYTNEMEKTKVLITGANGQLGHEMRRALSGIECHSIFTDIDQLDITDLEAVRRMAVGEGVDVIVNCAAYTNVDRAEDDRATADLINNKAVGNLALAANESGATLIHVSTDYVFDGCGYVPYREDDATAPTGVYGETKLAGELAVTTSGCRHIIIRTAWLYSRWGNNFLKTMLRLTSEREILNVVFDQAGTPTYAGDLADAIAWIIARRMTDKQGIYHFSNEGVCSWYDFTVAINRLAGHRCDVRPIHSDEYPSKVRRPHYSVLDKTKFRQAFGFKIPYWMDSVEKCINGLKAGKNEQL